MEPSHQLAAVASDSPSPNLVVVQADEVVVVRCPICKGLRSVGIRHITRYGKVCKDCRKGKVIHKSQFHNYWLKRFTMEEIEDMAKAIWG